MYSRYCLALGRFVHLFSVAETLMTNLLWFLSGVKIEVAPAVFNSVRMANARDSIRRILDMEPRGGAVRQRGSRE